MSKRSNRGKDSGKDSESEVAHKQGEVAAMLSDNCKVCGCSENSRMVCCDTCGDWYHFECVGVDEGIEEVDWSCKDCEEKRVARNTASLSTSKASNDTNPASLGTIPKRSEEVQTLQRQMNNLLEQMGKQKESYERLLKAREQEQQTVLKRQQEQFMNQLKAMEQKFASRLQVPNANSTTINPTGDAGGSLRKTPGEAAKNVELQLTLLAEKQALEMRHLDERMKMLQMNSGICNRSEDGGTGLNPGAQEFVPPTESFWPSYSSHDLSRSQLAARQAVAKELPAFTGAPEEWPLFIATYENTTRMCGYSDEENLLRLQRSLRGKALEAVRSRLLYPAGLSGVIQTLRTLFGRPEVIIHSLVCRIRNMPPPKTERLGTLIDFGVAVQNLCATIKACGLEEQLCNTALLQELVDRLPPTIKLNWALHRQTLPSVSLADYGTWLEKLVEAACVVTIPSSSSFSAVKTEKRGRREDVNVHLEADSDSSPKQAHKPINKACLICLDNCSSAPDCKRFRSLDISGRWAALKQHKLCRKCLKKHFGACEVKTPCGRRGCTYMHHELLHDDSRYKADIYPKSTQPSEGMTSQNCNTHVSQFGKVLFRYIPVTVHGRGVSVKTYAFLDDGSSATFMETSLLRELKLDGEPYPLCLNWTAKQKREEKDSVKLSLEISGVCGKKKQFRIPKVHTVRCLALPDQTVDMDELASKYEHLKGLPIDSYRNISPRLLIGIDNCRLGHALHSREGKEDEPVASKTRLGWLIYGPCSITTGSANESYSACHSFHICPCSEQRDTELHRIVKDYFSLESIGVAKTDKPLLSKEDDRAIRLLEKHTIQKGDRYESGLLWKYDDVRLPNSKAMAMKRLVCLEKKLLKEPDLAEAFAEKLREYERKGYTKKLSPTECDARHPRSWYLPIFPVQNPNKPGKLRIVWDAAAAVNGISLNAMLLKGPDLLTSIVTVLFKFREFRIAVAGDIVEMFHQVLMNGTDQQSLKFLWRGCDQSRDPDVYAMVVMIFGATCSPSCALFVKNVNAQRFEEQFPRAVEAIVHEHYMDDMLTSVESEAEAGQLAKQVEYIHGQAGFQIHNWLSNSKNVLEALGVKDGNEKNLNTTAELASDKVLGMWWCTSTDTLLFKLSPRQDSKLLTGQVVPTKRQVLSTLMKIYDPLGLIGNFLMFLKILLQEIWRSGVGWDDPIATKEWDKWRLWLKILPRIESIRIPRCYRKNTSTESNIQLHVFVDASENSYAAVAYLRFEEGETVECAIVGSKARVAPLRFVSIPRLELQAAVIGVRLAHCITDSLKLKPAQRFFWSDSQDVICWLNADHRKYSQFVGCRVGEILESTEAAEWNWIPTKSNVADDATKWQRLPNLSSEGRWFRGPKFLWESKDKWPIKKSNPEPTALELRAHALHHNCLESTIKMDKFSRWKRLVRHVAFVWRYPLNIRRKKKKVSLVVGPLTQEELARAENCIYKIVQAEVFSEEIRILQEANQEPWASKRSLSKHSSLYKLSPNFDKEGVLRLHGRIDACDFIGDETKHPIILPKSHHVTDLIISHIHEQYCHLNHQTVLNEVRQKYYVPSLRAVYRRIRNNCQFCRIRNTKPQPPMMGDLPSMRMKAFIRPFSYVGIDYFGPMPVLVGRRVEKRWGVLITCMTVRAVHIEIAHSLSAESCIFAIRNFVTRRGMPLEIISDRGTNFIGASRELRDALDKMNQNKVIESFVSSQTKWSFNPPTAPHFGGCWERLIQSIKKTLNNVKPNRTPTDEMLRNMLLEVEAIINARPLTEIPLDYGEASPLIPNDILIGSSNGSKPSIAFNDSAAVVTCSWRMSQVYANEFWRRWVAEYLPTLTKRTKWFQPVKPLAEGDIVIVVDQNQPRNSWPKGRIIEVARSKDRQVRRASVQTATGILERPAVKLAVLDVASTVSKSDH
ncbi:uncharacterized protein LOC128746219 [Sabethes cyaneus]|uniref:uncharacterized protein LOC128746219 n=1 Tax=Sabethes cyaneus TaxID=53552 RepID=UPI00237DF12C|nr:uncharacterized protein LOC128746219 [Sabethes cyaneus]